MPDTGRTGMWPDPATEPRTEAGRRIVKEWLMLRPDYPANTARVRDMVLEAEAEAAQGAAPRAEGLDPDPLLRLPCNCDNDGWYVHDPDCLRGIAWEARAEARESAVSAVVKGMTDLRREAEAARGAAPLRCVRCGITMQAGEERKCSRSNFSLWCSEGAAPRAEGLDVERLYGAIVDELTALWGEPADEYSERIRPIVAQNIADRYASRPSDERDGEESDAE